MNRSLTYAFLISLPVFGLACAGPERDLLDGRDDPFPTGKADSIAAGSAEALAVLALVNDPATTLEILDDDARLHRTAAANIIEHRDGPSGLFDTLAELDSVSYVGPFALGQLLQYAIETGFLAPGPGKFVDVIFSPQSYDSSHNARVAQLIDDAQHTVDVAMYSFSDAQISDALEAAVERGVKVRFVFETGNDDRKKTGADLLTSKSGRLEQMGINVRYVNKIMHHKFVIVDGPRDDQSRAHTAIVASGSGNWSFGAATKYDENTLLFSGYPELALRLQNEFNLLWEHSRDVVVDADLPYELSGLVIGDIADSPDVHAFFTSDNFDVSGTTFKKTGRDTISTAWVEAIENATESIRIASGHLRSRPISEAVMAKAAQNPGIDIRIYLDGQEYISEFYQGQQDSDLAECLAGATTDTQIRNCTDKGFYFGYDVGEIAGVPVRYKYYSYRWHYSYADQMHHKYMVIDGDELYTGSYNLSNNAERNTFENTLAFSGPDHADLVAAYESNFETLWDTERDGLLDELRTEIETADSIPLVFESMALTWSEITSLKELIRDNCADINTQDFRVHPDKHKFCPR